MQSRTGSTITLIAGVFFAAVLTFAFSSLTGCDSSSQKSNENVEAQKNAVEKTYSEPAPESAEAVFASEELLSIPKPAPEPVTFESADAVYRDGRYTEAAELFDTYTEDKPDNPWGHYMLGLSNWKAGRLDEAETALNRALELDPSHVKSLFNLGRVLLEAGRTDEAFTKIDEALALDSLSADGFRLKGRALYMLGRLEEAEDAFREAVWRDNEDAWSMNNLGLLMLEEGFPELALPPLARAVEIRDDVAIFHNNLGMALEHTGQIRAAEAAYLKATAINADYEKARLNASRVANVKEDPELIPDDLTKLAADFVSEIASWSDEAVARETFPARPAENDTAEIE